MVLLVFDQFSFLSLKHGDLGFESSELFLLSLSLLLLFSELKTWINLILDFWLGAL